MASAREAALLTLTAMDRQKAWSNGHLQKAIRDAGLDRRDAALATRLCFGVLQNRLLLDFYLQQCASMKLEKMESKVRNGLRIGLYQMLFLDKIPASAAVSEAVELTKKHCKNPRAAGLLNGILRALARRLNDLPALDRTDRTSYLSLLYSHPRWLVESFASRLPEDELEPLLQWDNGEPPVTVQVNTTRTTLEETTARLEAEGVAVQPHPWLPGCLILSATGDLAERTAYKEGLIYAQDPAARLAVLAMDPKPGDKVLDACAAPGGKSAMMAELMENRGSITACDIHTHRLELIEAAAARLGVSIIGTRLADGTSFDDSMEEQFDYVLYDTPPVFLVTDAAALGKYMDGAIFVIKHNSTERGMVVQAKKNLEIAGVKIFGAIYSNYSAKSTGAYSKYSRYNYYDYYSSYSSNPDHTSSGNHSKKSKNDSEDDIVEI